jgi:flagellar biosynthesis/type III secretory pathway protein FliH
VAIHPADAAALKEAKGGLLAMTEGLKTLEFVERASVPQGGVVIETNAGQLDARIEEQLSVMRAALLPNWSRPAANPPSEHG